MDLTTPAGIRSSFPHSVQVKVGPNNLWFGTDTSRQRVKWLGEHVGKHEVAWMCYAEDDCVVYTFKSQDHAVRFTLTWC